MAGELSDSQVSELRTMLERRQEEVGVEIRRELAESDNEHYADLAGVGDLEDQALADLLVDQNLAEIHHYVQEYRAADAALMRIARGEYGVCIDCGGPIAADRLYVYPAALRCIDCQDHYEKTHAGEGHPTL